MNARPRVICARADASRGNNPDCGCTLPRWSRMAALSVSTLPSSSTSVGIWPNGFTFRSSTKASLVSHDAVSTMRNGAPPIPSATWTDAEPEPFLPYSVYIAPPRYEREPGPAPRTGSARARQVSGSVFELQQKREAIVTRDVFPPPTGQSTLQGPHT